MEKLTKIMLLVVILLIFHMVDVSAIEVSVDISERYQEVQAGESIYFEIELKDKEAVGRHDISLEYEIKYGDEVIAFLKELKAIETQASFVESIEVPEDAESGIHSIVVTVNYEDSAEASFYVKSLEEEQIEVYFLMLAAVVLVVGSLIWLEVHKTRKKVELLKRSPSPG